MILTLFSQNISSPAPEGLTQLKERLMNILKADTVASYYDMINSLSLGRFESKFRLIIFKLILVIDGWGIALRWMSLDFIDE